MELGELREPMREKELRVLFLEERSLFLERREDQEERCLVGNFSECGEVKLLVGKTPGGVYFVPDARSTPREEIYTWVKV